MKKKEDSAAERQAIISALLEMNQERQIWKGKVQAGEIRYTKGQRIA